jgi:hypothetical protein
MVESQKTPSNRLLIISIFLSVLCFLATTYHFKTEIDNLKNQSLSLANKVCAEKVRIKKTELIESCEKQFSSEEKKLCSARNEVKFIKLEQLCPRELGALKARYSTSENQVLPFFKAALCTMLLWLIGFGGQRIYIKFTNRSDI